MSDLSPTHGLRGASSFILRIALSFHPSEVGASEDLGGFDVPLFFRLDSFCRRSRKFVPCSSVSLDGVRRDA